MMTDRAALQAERSCKTRIMEKYRRGFEEDMEGTKKPLLTIIKSYSEEATMSCRVQ